MDDENASCMYDSEEDEQLSLLDLPVEVRVEKNISIHVYTCAWNSLIFIAVILSRLSLVNAAKCQTMMIAFVFLFLSWVFILLCVYQCLCLIYCAAFQIFLHICSFLEASTLVHSLSLVCKQFYLILKDDSLWKARINHIWPDASYPLLRPG